MQTNRVYCSRHGGSHARTQHLVLLRQLRQPGAGVAQGLILQEVPQNSRGLGVVATEVAAPDALQLAHHYPGGDKGEERLQGLRGAALGETFRRRGLRAFEADAMAAE